GASDIRSGERQQLKCSDPIVTEEALQIRLEIVAPLRGTARQAEPETVERTAAERVCKQASQRPDTHHALVECVQIEVENRVAAEPFLEFGGLHDNPLEALGCADFLKVRPEDLFTALLDGGPNRLTLCFNREGFSDSGLAEQK